VRQRAPPQIVVVQKAGNVGQARPQLEIAWNVRIPRDFQKFQYSKSLSFAQY